MIIEHQEGSSITALLAPQADVALTAVQTAQAVITTWHIIDDALTPVVGARGLVALYLRALHLTASDPVLAVAGQPGKLAFNAATTGVSASSMRCQVVITAWAVWTAVKTSPAWGARRAVIREPSCCSIDMAIYGEGRSS